MYQVYLCIAGMSLQQQVACSISSTIEVGSVFYLFLWLVLAVDTVVPSQGFMSE